MAVTGPQRRRVVVPDLVRERRHGAGRRVGEPIIEAGSAPRRIIAWNRSRRRRAAARTGTGTAFSMIATVIASSRVKWARFRVGIIATFRADGRFRGP